MGVPGDGWLISGKKSLTWRGLFDGKVRLVVFHKDKEHLDLSLEGNWKSHLA